MRARPVLIIIGSGLCGTTGMARAQCAPVWNPHPAGAPNAAVLVMGAHDDGTGPALYLGGDFARAGTSPASGIARWDASGWRSLGAGVSPAGSQVRAIASFDADGPGPGPAHLYIGGSFLTTGVPNTAFLARWDGSAWSSVGWPGGTVRALLVVDEGAAGPGYPVLYAGSLALHRFDGAQWSQMGGVLDGDIWALATKRDPGAPRPTIYAGGGFGHAGAVSASNIAAWDGGIWSALGTGLGSYVFSLAVFDDDGPGPHPEALYAGGRYDRAGSVQAHCIAKWDGTAWSDLLGGTGIHDEFITSTLVWDDDGPGPHAEALYVGGVFGAIGGVGAFRVAKWDGVQWSGIPGLGPFLGVQAEFYSLGTFDPGSGPCLVAGGYVNDDPYTESWGLARWGCPWPCFANCDNSTVAPVLSVSDFACFLYAFTTGSARANCDASSTIPSLNVLDFVCFLNRFAAGCP